MDMWLLQSSGQAISCSLKGHFVREFPNTKNDIREVVYVKGQEGALEKVKGKHWRSREGLVERFDPCEFRQPKVGRYLFSFFFKLSYANVASAA